MHSERKHLLKSASTIGFLTFLSRVVGMVRDIVSARLFGTGRVWDAFIFAFMIPNFLRRLVGEGALSSAFIPVYTQVLKEKGRAEADKVAQTVFTMLLFGLCIFLFLMYAIINTVLSVATLPDKLVLVLHLLEILFPYILFLSFVALSMGILNCHRHFFSPSFAPVILNVVWIGAVLVVCPFFGETLEDKACILATAILIAGALQFAVQLFPLSRIGFRFRIVFDFLNPAIHKILWLLLPAALGFAVTQINILVDLTLGFLLGDGANSSLWYGNRLMQFPLGVFGIAMGTALLPTLSRHATTGNTAQTMKAFLFSLRMVFLIIIPASCGLIALRIPVMQLLFQRGSFTALSTARCANTLMYYCFGLFAYAGLKIVVSGFYSHQDTKTPVRVGVLCMVLNIIFNLILMWPLREGGLAFATAISSSIQFFVLLYLYHKHVVPIRFTELIPFAFKVAALSILMGFLAFWCFSWLSSSFLSDGSSLSIAVNLLISIAAAVIFYVIGGMLLRIEEVVRIFQPGYWRSK